MQCSVNNCSNDNRTLRENHGISFHIFPKDRRFRNIWRKVLGMADEPEDNSAVCSDHFRSEDIYVTQCGQPRIRDGAFPVVVQVCRICLATDVKMYNIRNRELQHIYADVCGIIIEEDRLKDKLPEKLCWECTARLLAASRFRNKAIKSHQLLTQLLHTSSYITLRDINSINRSELESNLSHHYNEPNECYLFIEEAVSMNAEVDLMEIEKKESSDEDDILKEEYLEVSHEVEVITQINNEVLSDYEDVNGSDDVEQHEDENEDENVKQRVLKRKVNIKDEDEQNYLNDDSGENVKEKAKEKKLNLIVKTPTKKVAEKKRKENQKAVDNSKPDGLDESWFSATTVSLPELVEEAQRRRGATRHRNWPYRCAVCGLGFRNRLRYDVHVARHSEQAGAYECFVCMKRHKTAATLRRHLASVHARRYSCKQCGFVTQTKSTAKYHQEWHAGIKYQCPHCPSEFEIHTTYLGHIRVKHGADFICELCGYTFLSKRGVTIHKNILHRFVDEKMPLEGPYCATCDVKFVSQEAHDRHFLFASRHSDKNNLNQIRNNPINTLDKDQNVGRRPTIHARDASDGDGTSDCKKLISCEQCDKQFPDFRSYGQHFRFIHPDKTRTQFSGKSETFMCEQCGRIFQNVTTLRDHIMLTHNSQKLFECDYCSRKFIQKTSLLRHMKSNYSGDGMFECGECGKGFSVKCMLATHSKTHLKQKHYDCSICGMQFIYSSNCRRHMWTHTALKPFKCEACDRTFANPSLQKNHFDHEHLKKPYPKRNTSPSRKRKKKAKVPVKLEIL